MELKKNPRQETKTVWDHGVRCDICKEEVHHRAFDMENINIEATIGKMYPGGDGFGTKYKIDCCARCFMEKVKPLLETGLGIDFSEADYNDPYPTEEVR